MPLCRAKAGLRFGAGRRSLWAGARVVELADTPDLGSGSARIRGSSPLARTTLKLAGEQKNVRLNDANQL